MSRALLLSLVAGCSRPVAIARDPAPVVVDAAPSSTTAPRERHFMDTSGGDRDCYREIDCTRPVCPSEGAPDSTWTAKLRAEGDATWCCHTRTICEFPAPK